VLISSEVNTRHPAGLESLSLLQELNTTVTVLKAKSNQKLKNFKLFFMKNFPKSKQRLTSRAMCFVK